MKIDICIISNYIKNVEKIDKNLKKKMKKKKN